MLIYSAQQLSLPHRFGDEVVRSLFDGFNGDFNRAVACDRLRFPVH
jgi:hypothetical protein